MNRVVAALVVAATLLLPGARGAPAEGLFSIQGDIHLPAGAYVETGAMGIFLGGTTQDDPPLDFTGFLLEAPSLVLTNYTKRFASVSIPGKDAPARVDITPTAEPSPRTLRNVTVTIAGPLAKGYVAVESTASSSQASLLAASPALLQSASRTELSSAPTVTSGSADTSSGYHRILSEPHALAAAPGDLSFEGSGKMKLHGMTLVVSHDQGEERIPTGGWYETQGGLEGPPDGGVYVVAWVVVTGDNLAFQASSPQEWTLAGGETSLDWHGEATFRATSGALETSTAVYGIAEDESHPTILDGTFRATLGTVRSGMASSELRVVGELAQTNLPVTQAKTVLPTPGGSSALLWLGLVVGVAVAAGGLVQWRRHARVRPVARPAAQEPILSPALAAEYYVGLAEQAIQFDDHAKALHWISLAREASPTSSDVATTMAYVLGEMGHYDEALEMYEEASRLDPSDGEADLNAARLAAQAGKPLEVVESLVLRALDRTPEFVFDVEEDLEFRPLAVRPTFREALARAWSRWGGERPPVSR